MASGTAMSVVGISCGFRLAEGPIIWGIVSAVAGFFIGGGITQWIVQKSLLPVVRKTKTVPELTLIVRCPEERYPELRQVLWQYRALSVGHADESNA
ncbi:hypothetical protein ACHHV8_33210 [Paenibacillus sp. TAB 01]|uniref:hypothetical protein n=1 Tax=Paenibacillus sp. TAB 01 TaxID=3368988 RepID=UPI0037519A8B